MIVAFISECHYFYKILSDSLKKNFPNLDFFHFSSPEELQHTIKVNFPVVVFKLSNQENYDLGIKKIRRNNKDATIIGLTLNKEFKTRKQIQSELDFIFNDQEIETKLNLYFSQQFYGKENSINLKDLELEETKRKYLLLNTNLSRCFLLVSHRKKSSEIAEEMCKSQRTIEKYVSELLRIFGVKRKQDLQRIVEIVTSDSSEKTLI